MYIYPQETINFLHKKIYGKSLENCTHLYPVMSWHNRRNGYDVVKEENALKTTTEGVDYMEKQNLERHK